MAESTPAPKFVERLKSWLPPLKREIWILAFGQPLLFIGQGFTLVYAAIYFVNQLGFSPTQVGLAQGAAGVSGILGRVWAGNAVSSPRLGRRGTLLLSAVIAAIGSFTLAVASSFPVLVTGNLLLGLGISLYWPAMLTVTTDLTDPQHRTEAMALTRLADNAGIGLGALLAGQYIARSGNYSALFVVKGLAYLVFAAVLFMTIAETRPNTTTASTPWQDWRLALSDRRMLTFIAATVSFTFCAAQVSSTLPLYLADFIPTGEMTIGFSETTISYLFVWYLLLKIVFQLPLTRLVQFASHVNVMMVALAVWCSGFLLIWLAGFSGYLVTALIIGAFAFVAIAEILYSPSASALIGDMAPVPLRGIYFSLESICWAVGFAIGPAIGGWSLDHPTYVGGNLWLYLIISGVVSGSLLQVLRKQVDGSLATSVKDAS
jgi:predicted MFS family arabinose efflux permease